MALLDKFLILFETDSAQASDDVEDLNKKLDETEKSADDAVQGMDSAADSASNLGSELSETATMAAQLIGSFLALDTIISTSLGVAQFTDKLGKLSQTYDINIQKLDAWGAAVERNGGSAEEFQGVVVGLQNQLNQIEFGGGTEIIQQLGMMGVSAFNSNGQLKDTFDILSELSGTFEGMDAGRAAALGQRLGLDQGTILLLQQGKFQVSELVKQQEALGGATEESYLAAANFNDALDNTGRAAQGLWQDFNTFVLPALTKFFDGVTSIVQWMRENKEFTIGFFAALGVAIAAMSAPILAIAGKFALIATAVTGISIAIAAVGEDLYAFFNGQKSLIGDFVDWVKGAFASLSEYIKGLFDFSFIGDEVKNLLSSIGLYNEDMEVSVKHEFLDQDGEPIKLNAIPSSYEAAMAVIQPYSENQLNSAPSYGDFSQMRNVYQSNTFSFSNSIQAKGVTPEQVRGQMTDEFGRQVSSAISNLEDGVDY